MHRDQDRNASMGLGSEVPGPPIMDLCLTILIAEIMSWMGCSSAAGGWLVTGDIVTSCCAQRRIESEKS